MDKEEKKIKKLIKTKLANLLAVEVEDISTEDNFKDDLHMGAVELTDFNHMISELVIDSDQLNFNEIENLADLYEVLF